MRKLLKKKVNVFGKGIPVFAFVILGLALVSAALIPLWGTITGLVTVSQGLFLDGLEWDKADNIVYSASLTSLDAKMISSGHYLDNQADVDATVYLKTTCLGGGDDCGDIGITTDTVGLSTRRATDAVDAIVDASLNGNIVTLTADDTTYVDNKNYASEARIVILGEDVGVTTLSDLVNMSWNVDVNSGYIAHVDVIVEAGDGTDALVFEYANVNNIAGAYPIKDGLDTFGVRGFVYAVSSTTVVIVYSPGTNIFGKSLFT